MSLVKDLNVRLRSIPDNFFHIACSQRGISLYICFVCILCMKFLKYACLLTRVLVCIKFIWFCIHYIVFTVDLGGKGQINQ